MLPQIHITTLICAKHIYDNTVHIIVWHSLSVFQLWDDLIAEWLPCLPHGSKCPEQRVPCFGGWLDVCCILFPAFSLSPTFPVCLPPLSLSTKDMKCPAKNYIFFCLFVLKKTTKCVSALISLWTVNWAVMP